jgi:hypothetical protein
VVTVTEGTWLPRLGDNVSSALLVVPSTVSVWHARHIVDGGAAMVLDSEVMNVVDQNLCTFFDLERR